MIPEFPKTRITPRPHQLVLLLVLVLGSSSSLHAQSPDPTFIPIPDNPPVYAINGLVLNERGEPISNATVIAQSGMPDNHESRTTTSNRDGHFQFENLPEWNGVSITADHPNYAHPSEIGGYIHLPLPRRFNDPPTGIVLRKAITFRGTLLDLDGAPAAGARVLADPPHRVLAREKGQPRFTFYETITDDAGAFEFTRLTIDKPELWFWHKDRPVMQVEADNLPADCVFRLTPGLVLRGCVINDKGDHIEGVSLTTVERPLHGKTFGPWFTSSAEDGSFTISGLPIFRQFTNNQRPAHAVVVDDARFKPDLYNTYLTPDGSLPFVEVALRDIALPGEIRVADLGRQGPPGSGTITVRVAKASLPPGDPQPYIARVQSGPAQDPYIGRRDFLSSESITFPDVPPGDYVVQIEGAAHAFVPKVVTLPNAGNIDVALEKGSVSLRGAVFGLRDDRERTRIEWRLENATATIPNFRGWGQVADDHTYTIDGLVPGEYTIIVQVGRNPAHRETLTLNAGPNQRDFHLSTGRIEGRIVGFDLAKISPQNDQIQMHETVEDGEPIQKFVQLELSPDGGFRADNVPPGDYTLAYQDRQLQLTVRQDIVLAPNQDTLYVELQAPTQLGNLSGTVLGLADLNLDPNAHYQDDRPAVYTVREGETRGWKWGQLDVTTGRYTITNLEEGTYGIAVRGAGLAIWREGVEIRAHNETVLDLEIPDACEVLVRFISETPVNRIALQLKTDEGEFYPVNFSLGSINSPAEANLVAERTIHLTPGQYIFDVHFGEANRLSLPVDIPPGNDPLLVEIANN